MAAIGPPHQNGQRLEDRLAERRQAILDAGRLGRKPIAYRNMTPAAFRSAAMDAGMPEMLAKILSDTDAGVEKGALFDDGGMLARLTGRPTTPFQTTIADFVRDQHAAGAAPSQA